MVTCILPLLSPPFPRQSVFILSVHRSMEIRVHRLSVRVDVFVFVFVCGCDGFPLFFPFSFSFSFGFPGDCAAWTQVVALDVSEGMEGKENLPLVLPSTHFPSHFIRPHFSLLARSSACLLK